MLWAGVWGLLGGLGVRNWHWGGVEEWSSPRVLERGGEGEGGKGKWEVGETLSTSFPLSMQLEMISGLHT